MKKLIKDKKYEIVWRDHFSTSGWKEKENLVLDEEVFISTVGFYIKSNRYYYFFAQHNGKYSYSEIMAILKNNIVKIKEIK